MAILLGIDVETSGLDPENDWIIEIGAVLYDWDTKMPMQILSELVDPTMEDRDWTLPEEITEITGITFDALLKYGAFEKDVLIKLESMIQLADYYVAHNGNAFDRHFMEAAYGRHSMGMPGKPWLDTMQDIKFDASIKTRNLHHLGADHMILNPFRHRAVFDVLTMFKVMEHYDLEAIIARSQEPTLFVQALVSFDEKELAKDRGYRWCAPKKIWWKSAKQSDHEAEKLECGFRTQLLDKAPE
jgi:DNA polymerase III subunit epsilon